MRQIFLHRVILIRYNAVFRRAEYLLCLARGGLAPPAVYCYFVFVPTNRGRIQSRYIAPEIIERMPAGPRVACRIINEIIAVLVIDNSDVMPAACPVGGYTSVHQQNTGLPGLDIRREVLRDYYNRKGRDGFDQAYRIPGMNKVLQAAGRVIRTKEDRGVILLLDERFREEAGGPLFPADMEDIRPCNIRTVGKMLKDFWDGGDEA